MKRYTPVTDKVLRVIHSTGYPFMRIGRNVELKFYDNEMANDFQEQLVSGLRHRNINNVIIDWYED